MWTSSPLREDLHQRRLAGGVREHAQLDLRVVGRDQHAALLGLEAAADLAPERRADGDVLHVRVRARQAPGLRDRLQERGVDARALVDELGEHVEVGLDQRRELAPALDPRDDLVLVADRLQHARVGRVARLAAALARQAELLEQDLAELLRRADQELLPGELEDLAVRAPSISACTRAVISCSRGTFRRTPSSSISRSTLTSGSSISSITARRPRSSICSRCQSASAPSSTASRRQRVLDVAGEAALLAQLGERVAAPRGLEQVGAEQRVVREPGRNEPERLRVVRDHRTRAGSAAATSSGPVHSPASTSPSHAAAKRQAAPSANSSPSGGSLARTASAELLALAAERGDRLRLALAHARRERHVGCRRGRRHVGVAERLLQPPQRVAQLVLAEDLAQARAVGLARGLGRDVDVDRHVALDRRELLGDARVLGVLEEVLFALGAR